MKPLVQQSELAEAASVPWAPGGSDSVGVRDEALRLARACHARADDEALLVRRVEQSLATGDPELVYSALVDAFIGLPGSARGQRSALLKRARSILPPSQHAFLERRVPAGLSATEPIPDARASVLTGGFIGTAQLVVPAPAPQHARTAQRVALPGAAVPAAPEHPPASASARPEASTTPERRSGRTHRRAWRIRAAAGALALAAVVALLVVALTGRQGDEQQLTSPSPTAVAESAEALAPSSSSVPEAPARTSTPVRQARAVTFLRSWMALLAEPGSAGAAGLFPPGSAQHQAVVEVLGQLAANGHAVVFRDPVLREGSSEADGRTETVTLAWSAVELLDRNGIAVEQLSGPGTISFRLEFESERPDARVVATAVAGT